VLSIHGALFHDAALDHLFLGKHQMMQLNAKLNSKFADTPELFQNSILNINQTKYSKSENLKTAADIP
jgi:hypothetical protein